METTAVSSSSPYRPSSAVEPPKAQVMLMEAPSAACLGDPVEMLAKLTADGRQETTANGSSQVDANRKTKAAAFREYQDATRKAKEERESAGFFSKLAGALGVVGTIASLVAGVAAVVATGGASLPAVLALASATMSGLALLNKECGIIKGELGDAINLTLSIGAAVTGVTGGCLGLAGVGSTAGGAVSATAKAADLVAKGAQLGSAVTQGAAGTAGVVLAVKSYHANMSDIDAKRKDGAAARIQRDQQSTIDHMRAMIESYDRSMSELVEAMNTRNTSIQQLATLRA
jgi:hypothetical protein